MKIRRLWSLRHWFHIFKRIPRLLFSSEVSLGDKVLLVAPALLYWVLPDVLPFIPVDDIAVTMLLMDWFVTRTERKLLSPRRPPRVR